MTAVLIISIILWVIYAALLIYYRQGWRSIPSFEPALTASLPITRITVIIPARNEGENIGQCLESICRQSYPKSLFEVLVVDDHSTDQTTEIVNTYSAKNIRLISLEEFIDKSPLNSYKKKSIEVAIAQSTGSLIVTTDADCTMPPDWLLTIASFYELQQPAFIAAPVAINCSNRFIEIFQALDFMTLQGITGASVHRKFHSMCNGANLAYEKKVFYEVNGFKGIDTIASGDDMLLMHKIIKHCPEKVLFLKSSSAIVQTKPMATLTGFFSQRIRWASKSGKYEDKTIMPVLAIVYCVNLVLIVLPILAIFNKKIFFIPALQFTLWDFWLGLLFAKTLAELFFLYPVARFFNKQNLLWLFPVAQLFHVIYTIIAGWLGKFGSYEWKQRRVK